MSNIKIILLIIITSSSNYTTQKNGGGANQNTLVVQVANFWNTLFFQSSFFTVPFSSFRLFENNIKKVSSPSEMGILLFERKQQLCAKNTELFIF